MILRVALSVSFVEVAVLFATVRGWLAALPKVAIAVSALFDLFVRGGSVVHCPKLRLVSSMYQ